MKSIDPKVRAEIERLLQGAQIVIRDGNAEAAAWRLADAAGLLREELPQMVGEDLCGRDTPTGRGYLLPTPYGATAAGPEVLIEVRNVYGNELIYPANEAARTFALLAKKKTLDKADLANIRALGFAVRLQPVAAEV